jgi:hypothetical protein
VKAKRFFRDHKPRREGIDPTRLRDVSGSLLHPNAPDKAYVDRERGVVVQVWSDTSGCDATPWAGTLRVAIKHTSAKWIEQATERGHDKPLTWDDMQAIKNHFWPDRIAIEIYPPHDKIVDVADMRWMWVLPKGAVLPFNLQSSSPERLES